MKDPNLIVAGGVDPKNLQAATSFGGEGYGSPVRFWAVDHITGARRGAISRRAQYWANTQHDAKRYFFDGTPGAGPQVGTPIMAGPHSAPWHVPLAQRRPSAPYRVPKIIVDAFTNMLFGEGRFPTFMYPGDAQTEDFARALVKAERLGTAMIRARDIGGSTGSVGLSWRFSDEGKPLVRVHKPENIRVMEWKDRDNLIPAHAIECYLFAQEAEDPERKGKMKPQVFWWRRDWELDRDVVYKPVLYVAGEEPEWKEDKEATNEHGDNDCRMTWIQNLPSDDVDGLPDYHGQYELMDTIDILTSVIARGGVLNLDPTLVIKMSDDALLGGQTIKKGSDNALMMGSEGDASYLELQGQSITAGISLIDYFRKMAFEGAQCVVLDPNTIASQGVSSLSMKAMYGPMLGKSGVHREQYGAGMERVIDQQVRYARTTNQNRQTEVNEETGAETVVVKALQLPPKVVEENVVDPVTGEESIDITFEARFPGEAESSIDTSWPAFFPLTPDDQQKIVQNVTTANGGKPVMSAKTGVSIVAVAMGQDPAEEQERMDAEAEEAKTAQAGMFPAGGGAVGAEDELPGGALPKREPFADSEEPEEDVDSDNAPEPA